MFSYFAEVSSMLEATAELFAKLDNVSLAQNCHDSGTLPAFSEVSRPDNSKSFSAFICEYVFVRISNKAGTVGALK